MELAMQIISNDKTVGSISVQNIKETNSKSLSTQAKMCENLVSMMPAIKIAFGAMGDGLVESSTKNESLKKQKGDYFEKWLEEPKTKLLKQMDY